MESHAGAGNTTYRNGMDCQWTIVGVPGKSIRIHFDVFETESEANCGYDFLSVFDGADEQKPLLRKICGSQTSLPDFISSTQSLTLRFKTNSSGVYTGFRLTYEVVNSKSFSSPHLLDVSSMALDWFPLKLNSLTDIRDSTKAFPLMALSTVEEVSYARNGRKCRHDGMK